MTNGEKYKSAKERAEAFCVGWMKDHPFNTIGNPVLSAFDWLDLEAPAEEPLPCPFCGEPVELDPNNDTVNCTNCNYMSGISHGENYIAAHNRVARAVKKGAK